VYLHRLRILAESRIHLKDFEVQETELNDNLHAIVTEHKELEEKVQTKITVNYS